MSEPTEPADERTVPDERVPDERVPDELPARSGPDYRRLDPGRIYHTADRLVHRVEERFPGSGLAQVAGQLRLSAGEAQANMAEIARPRVWVRLSVGLLIALLALALLGAVWTAEWPDGGFDLAVLITTLEAGINDLVLVGAGIFFLLTVENRLKRRMALRELDELRSLAHVIDMHQLTKDPDPARARVPDTESSPKRVLSRDELGRYLHYCTELLAVTGKVAALYVQDFGDAVVLASVNEIESLTTGLSRKIWQKLVILHDQ